MRYFVFTALQDSGVNNPESVSAKVAEVFVDHPNWRQSDADLRELRKDVTFAVYSEEDDIDQVARIVDELFSHLEKASIIE